MITSSRHKHAFIHSRNHVIYTPLSIHSSVSRPVANAFNFGVVPPPYRLAAINVVAVVWNAFLSYVNSTDFAERFHEKAKGTFSL